MNETLNVMQSAEILNLDQGTVRKRIKGGELPTLKTGRKSIITPVAIEYYKFISEHKKTLEGIKTSAKFISFVNHKGGCSKTTSAYSIAALLEKFGNKVLLVDLDPQGNSTKTVLEPIINKDGITLPHLKTIKDLLIDKEQNEEVGLNRINEVIRKSKFGFDAIPCDLSLNSIMTKFESSSYKEVILKELLTEISDIYDYVLFDTPPTLGFSVMSALTASDYIIIVTLAEAYSILGVEQTISLSKTIKKQNSILINPKKMEFLGTIISKAEMNTNVSKYFINELKTYAKEINIPLWDNYIIPKTTKIPETQATGELITDVFPKELAALNYFNISMLMDIKVKKDRIKEKLS